MVTRLLRLIDLYKQAPSSETEEQAKQILLEARLEQDRLYVAGDNISDITRFISEVEYYLYEYCGANNN